MRVSIITVCYNAASTIEQTIKSVLGQTYRNIEYIIIDGNSTDGTVEILEQYKDKVSKIICEADSGIYNAMNKGIMISTGDIIGIINADDWYELTAVENVVKCFEEKEVDIVHGDIKLVWEDGRVEEAPTTDSLDKLWYSMVVRHPATFVKREIYIKYGLFDENYKIAADYEFILRCYVHNVAFFYLEEILSHFRKTGISNQKKELCIDETRKIALSYASKAPNGKEIVAMINKQIEDEKFLRFFNDNGNEIINIIQKRLPIFEKGVVIWGTGIWGCRSYKLFKEYKILVPFFLDSNISKCKTNIENTLVMLPDDLKGASKPIFIAIKTIDINLEQQIEKMGLRKEEYYTLSELIEEVKAEL